MTPDAIRSHAERLRRKIQHLKETVGFDSYKPVQEVFSMADDLCELVIALAENQKLAGEALAPSTTVIIESNKENDNG